MGECAEDILDGVVCEFCGEVFDDIIDGDEAPGFPRRCERCEPPRSNKKNRAKTIQCDGCKKWFKAKYDLAAHKAAKGH